MNPAFGKDAIGWQRYYKLKFFQSLISEGGTIFAHK